LSVTAHATGAPASQAAGFSPEPQVRLLNSFSQPFNNAVATARTCYSSKVILPEDVDKDEKSRAQRDAIAASTYQAGHHTTLQHATFQFVLENVSRQFIWSFLHSHPFYNSEQVSQRFVTVSPERIAVPPLEGRAREIFLKAASEAMGAYFKLIDLLKPVVEAEYKRIFPLRNVEEKRWARAIQKRAQEVARYVLPLATHSHLYHTISGLTLLRYRRLCLAYDASAEQRQVVEKMIDEVRKVDPLFADRAEDPLPLEDTPEHEAFASLLTGPAATRAFVEEFDRDLGPLSSKLVDWKANGEAVMAQSVRSVLGLPRVALSDDEALDRVMNPARNGYFSESLNLTAHAKITRAMNHPHFTFRKRISHTADSQDQRHRMTPASRPVLAAHLVPNRPDYVTPALVAAAPAAKAFYEEAMASLWKSLSEMLDAGAPAESAMYLLPNAVNVRFEESGDLSAFHHKWTKRLCYTAQEEIWKTSQEEWSQVREVAPRLAKHIAAPCALRQAAGEKPFCPEGDRFCGVLVWKKTVDQYARLI
jgi:flavin-dependent thymidylate synthase